ncbi:MAG: hypothetical protein ACI39R_07525 [Lachnospiraceae bacterium]
MLLDMLDISSAYATVGSFAALGVGVKILLGSIYKRDIRNARSIEHTKKRWMKRMKRNFEKTFGDGLCRDAELFVENEMNGRRFGGISLKSFDERTNQFPLVILTATTAFDFLFITRGRPITELLSFTFFGVTMCLAIHTFNMMVNNESKEKSLRIMLTQYFGNEKLPLILTNRYEDEKLISENENYSPNALVAVTKEIGDKAEKEAKSEKTENISTRTRRKRLKAEKLRLKRLMKQQKQEERIKRRKAREMVRQQAIKIEYEEKMKKLQEKYKLNAEENKEQESVQLAFATAGAETGEEVKRVIQDRKNIKTENVTRVAEHNEKSGEKKDVLNQTLQEAFPESRTGKDDEKLIEEVLKEYLFR